MYFEMYCCLYIYLTILKNDKEKWEREAAGEVRVMQCEQDKWPLLALKIEGSMDLRCQQHLEVGKDKETFPLKTPEETSPAYTLILAW